ncbi:putative lipoprotein [Yersinia aldovae]|uniref:LPS translocon maturation chaperone LptM n=1 Tax=Yersinia aldovae TaxID=29483 RepID=UPI0005E61D7D|nr:lipoprotein [Yersinia aldovae]CNI16515.1 putative lipoprotein [Yersinia aldovae]
MKKELCWPMTAMMVLALTGCGLKGPLYFPPADKPKVETAQPDSGQVERNQQDLSGKNQTKSIAGPQ